MRIRIIGGVTILLALLPNQAVSQEMRLDVGAGLVTSDSGEGQTGIRIAPGILWSEPSAALLARAEAVLTRDGRTHGVVSIAAKALSARRGFGLSVRGDASGMVTSAGLGGAGAIVSPAGIYTGTSWSIEAGPRLGLIRRPSADGRLENTGWPLLGTGSRSEPGSTVIQGIATEVRAERGGVQWVGGWSSMQTVDGARWEDLAGGVGVNAGRASAGLTVGQRSGAAAERWAQARMSLDISSRVQLLVRGGRYPLDPISGRPGGTTAEVGLSLRSTPPFRGGIANRP